MNGQHNITQITALERQRNLVRKEIRIECYHFSTALKQLLMFRLSPRSINTSSCIDKDTEIDYADGELLKLCLHTA